jgi:hypothetical protein
MSKMPAVCFFLLITLTSSGQESVVKFVGDYFRVNPFEAKFSTFVRALSRDKQLLNKMEYTDEASDRSVSGNYKVFNPFNINASEVEVGLKSIGNRDYFGVSTPMYIYKLTARFADSPEARKKIRRDYWLMINRFRRLYTFGYHLGLEHPPLRRKDRNKDGESTNFFFAGYKDMASCNLVWTTPPSSDEIEVNISVCFAVINDRVYPLGHYPGRPQNEYYDLVTWKNDLK